jgi:hypothetical protein
MLQPYCVTTYIVIQAQIPLVELNLHTIVFEYYIITYAAVLVAFIALCHTLCPRRNEAVFLESALKISFEVFIKSLYNFTSYTEEENWYHSEMDVWNLKKINL